MRNRFSRNYFLSKQIFFGISNFLKYTAMYNVEIFSVFYDKVFLNICFLRKYLCSFLLSRWLSWTILRIAIIPLGTEVKSLSDVGVMHQPQQQQEIVINCDIPGAARGFHCLFVKSLICQQRIVKLNKKWRRKAWKSFPASIRLQVSQSF